ncbi:MAG: hypothetical protein B6229_07870 [Spirochaetaceae bacterium 4572_7]|nr:MAG: hypothetical protein B6229_07870 [Spirochaetaceae bacterium 4572_7]
MIRLEIISNNTIEFDILEALEAVTKDLKFSKITSVHGRGNSSPKQGDAIWPEENFIFIIYCTEELAKQYITAISTVKSRFKQEGLKVFSVPCMELTV